MKKLFILQDSLANKISYYHLLLLLMSLPFNMVYSHIILISFCIHTLIQADAKHVKAILSRRTFILQSVFWVTVASTIYTVSPPQAFTQWGLHLTILLLPGMFSITRLDVKKYQNALLTFFAASCSATVIFLYWSALFIIRHNPYPFTHLFTGMFTNHNFSQPLPMHATFLSMQLIIALVFVVIAFINQKRLTYKIPYAVFALILLAGLLQLCSKSALFCVFVSINLIIPFWVLKNTQRHRFLLIAGLGSLICLIGVSNSKAFRDRFLNDFKRDMAAPKPGNITDERMARWQSGMELIKQSPVIGHGAGSELVLLRDVFFRNKFYISFLNRLNVHSQYLSFLIKSGIIGLSVYLLTLTFGFRLAFKQKDALFLSFLLVIAVISFSENLLDVDKGIIFYAFFFSFFVYSTGEKSRVTDVPICRSADVQMLEDSKLADHVIYTSAYKLICTLVNPAGNRLAINPVIITEHNTEEIVAH